METTTYNSQPVKNVRSQDLGERIESALQRNYKAVIAVFAVVLVAIGAYAVWNLMQERTEKAAQEELFHITSELEKKVASVNEAAMAKVDPKKIKDPLDIAGAEKSPEALTRDLGPQVQALESFVKDKAGTKASFMAAMTVSDIYLDYKDPKKAVEVLEPVAEKPAKDNLLYGLVNSQLGLAHSNAGNCDEAIKAYDRVLSAKAQSHLHAQMLVRKGVCLMSLNKHAEAKDVFQQARTDYPESVSGRTAESFERLLALKKGQVK